MPLAPVWLLRAQIDNGERRQVDAPTHGIVLGKGAQQPRLRRGRADDHHHVLAGGDGVFPLTSKRESIGQTFWAFVIGLGS